MVERIFSHTIEITLALSFVMLLLLFLSNRLDQRYAAKCKYTIWLVIATRLSIPINATLPQLRFRIWAPYRLPESTLISFISRSELAPMDLPPPPGPLFSCMQILTAIWIVGGFCYFLSHIIGYSIFKNNLKRWGKVVTDQDTLCLYYRIKHEMKIYEEVTLKISPFIYTPMMTGFTHPQIILPDCNYTPIQLEMIFRHELVHYQRKDYLYKLLLLVIGTIHWFNPLVHLLIRKASQDIETSCDSEVIRGQGIAFIKKYLQSILEVAQKSCQKKSYNILVTRMESSKDILRRRFTNILAKKERKKGTGLLIFVFLLCTLGTSLFLFRGVDKNVDLAHRMSEQNIHSIVVKMNGSHFVDCTEKYKSSLCQWLRNMEVEPSLTKGGHTHEAHITYIITNKDGKQLQLTNLGNRHLLLNGKEYRSIARGISSDR